MTSDAPSRPTERGAQVPFALRGRIGDDERVIWSDRPHPLFILLASLGLVIGLGVAFVVALLIGPLLPASVRWWAVLVPVGLTVLLLAWRVLDWFFRGYALTETNALRVSGVLRQTFVELRLSRVQHTVLDRTLLERILGLGTIGFASAGTGSVELVWRGIGTPAKVLDMARGRIGGERGGDDRRSAPAGASGGDGDERPPLIGLAGGIGAGKSFVAGLFESLGCVVVDSDQHARAALDEPGVRDELVAWWGEDIVGADGNVDRRRIADIVFADSDQRRRLEALIHPVVHRKRQEAIEQAAQAGKRAVIVDAPLLFEAKVNEQCDAVVFVDAPHEVRVERVRERGWDEAELARREAAQSDLGGKREASDFVLMNDGPRADVEVRVKEILEAVLRG